jgi:hypothetical protein
MRYGYIEGASMVSRSSSPAARSATLKLSLEDCLSERSSPGRLGDEAIDASQSSRTPSPQSLEWTCLPQTEVCQEERSGVLCRVRLPANSSQRAGKIHLTRSTRIEPAASRPKPAAKSQSKPPPLPASLRDKQAEEIHVTEREFRRCGHDLKLLPSAICNREKCRSQGIVMVVVSMFHLTSRSSQRSICAAARRRSSWILGVITLPCFVYTPKTITSSIKCPLSHWSRRSLNTTQTSRRAQAHRPEPAPWTHPRQQGLGMVRHGSGSRGGELLSLTRGTASAIATASKSAKQMCPSRRRDTRRRYNP